MKHKSSLIPIAGVAVVTALIALFVQIYGIMQANWLAYGLKISLADLPTPTAFYHRYPFLGYVLPLAALATFFVGRGGREGRSMAADACLSAISIIALAWLFAAILAWQLPAYYPVAAIQ